MTEPEMTAAGPAPIGAADLRLRGDPPRVTRLSRRMLAALALAGTAGIGGAAIYALRPAAPATRSELYATDTSAPADSLAGAPKDYAQVPRLGPPLPGDLGRPILAAQRRGIDAAPPPVGPRAAPGPADGAGSAAQAAQAARERARQERDAARTSRVFAGDEAVAARGRATPAAAPAPAIAQGAAGAAPLAGATEEMGPAARRAFLRAGDAVAPESAFRITPPGSPYIIQAGSVIAAALITGIRSDLPGTITAQVTQNVYDSVTGRHLLIPQGSRLIGEYDTGISFGQDRVLLAWDRLILPDGRSLLLDRLPAADPAGRAGLRDRADQHWGGLFRAALISTLLGIGAEAGGSGDGVLLRALRRGAWDSIGRTGQDLVRRQMNVQPTLTIRPGFQLRVIVTRDLVLEPAKGDSQ